MGIKNSGFTLIEMLMVLGIIAVIMPAIMSISYAILTQQLRIYRLTETKRQGDYIINIMKEKIARDARALYDNVAGANVCAGAGTSFSSPSGTTFDFVNDNGDTFSFRQVGNNMVFNDNTILPVITSYLNDTRVTITNLTIECVRKTLLTHPLVGFSFDITFVDSTPTVREGVSSLHYQTKVKLR